MWNLLGLAVLVTCCADPGVVGTLSFQLSYAAMAGMLAVGPGVARLLPPDLPAIVRWPIASLATSLGATLGTLPWSALVFQSLAPLGFVANLVAVPISGCAVPLALVARFVPGGLGDAALVGADSLTGALLVWLEAVRGPLWHPASRWRERARSARFRSSCGDPASRSRPSRSRRSGSFPATC